MKENDAISQLIDRYLAGEMEAKEQAAFELRLQQDIPLKQRLAQEKKIDNYLSAFLAVQGDEKLKSNLRELGDEFVEEEVIQVHKAKKQSTKPRKIAMFWWVGAAAASLLATWFIWKFLFFSPTPDQLFADNLQRYPEKISLVTKGASTEDFVAIQAAFDEKDYTKVTNLAKPIVEQLDLDGAENYDLTFAVGYSYLQVGLSKNAIPYFTALKAGYNYPEPHWYHALALLDLNDIPACRQALEVLIQKFPESKYAEAGGALLGKLE